MLENLDKIPWGKLKHAYGAANDVPGLIRMLASGDKEQFEGALWHLYGNIFHQGTRYEAAPHAVPFIYELLGEESVQQKEQLISLLVSLALGYEESYLEKGLDVVGLRAKVKLNGWWDQVDMDCYDAVKTGLSILQKLVHDNDAAVSNAAVYALAWFPEEASTSVVQIHSRLKELEEENEIADAVLALGFLRKSSTNDFDVSFLDKYLESEHILIRTSAALALIQTTYKKEYLDILIHGLAQTDQLEGFITFNEGSLIGYIGTVLARIEGNDKNIIVGLCEALKESNPYRSVNITAAILQLVNRGRKKPIRETPKEELSELDLFALEMILEFGGWKIGIGEFANFSYLMQGAGLPDSHEKLATYLSLS